MKALLFALALTATARAQDELKIPDVTIPHLPKTGADIAAFTPRGWVLEKQITGDLNNDGRPDLAFVLQDNDPRNRLKQSADSDYIINTNPRILAIAFANPTGTGYTLVAQNSTLIPRWTEPNQDDHFDNKQPSVDDGGTLHIARNALSIGLHYFSSMGGWDAGLTTFTFRYQNNCFELIGLDNDNMQRGSGEETKTSANYSTHQLTIHTTNEQTKTNKTKHRQLPNTPPKTLDNIGDGMDFEIPGQS